MTRQIRISAIIALALTVLISACSAPEPASGINDPYEAVNRQRHENNKKGDRTFLRPVAMSYGEGTPEPLRKGIGNFARNLGLPGAVVNNLLQFRLGDAAHNTTRFLLNSTVGIGGLFDPGTAIGLDERSTDFGETLYVWGVGEGPYLELSSLGPSTTRDAVGKGVDLLINPVWYLVGWPEVLTYPAAVGLERIDSRYRFASTVDSVLYESADSYAQSRLLYLENRRFELSGDIQADEGGLYDIYEEAYE